MALKKKMTTKGRKPAKKTLAKVARNTNTVKKATTKVVNLPTAAITSKQTKAQIYNEIVEITGLSKPEVKKVTGALRNIIERHVKAKGSGEVTLPDLGIKVRRIQKKATKARMGRNPFTGDEIRIAAKPPRKSVKATALKLLKALA
ncbi:MAG TPA: HU family DNA-binding protein [Gammaproteobacteria bacterium]|nr:HU family DNA-binding protein [Gammaproteobacteria bacterium]